MLAAARMAWEAAGYTIHGAALAGKAGEDRHHQDGKKSKLKDHMRSLPEQGASRTVTVRSHATGVVAEAYRTREVKVVTRGK